MQPDVTLVPEAYDEMARALENLDAVNTAYPPAPEVSAGLGAMMGAFFGMMMIFYLGIILVLVISQWKVFVKAGRPGWAALVPFYNAYVLLKIAGMSGWWLLALLIPLVNIVVMVMVSHRVSVAFGHGVGFTLGLIFLPVVFWPILAFGNSQYQGNDSAESGQVVTE